MSTCWLNLNLDFSFSFLVFCDLENVGLMVVWDVGCREGEGASGRIS